MDGETATGTLSANPPGISGRLTGTLAGHRLTYRVPFSYPERRCEGVIQGTVELANHGRLLVGELGISGACSGDEPETGTLSLRRVG